MKKGVMCGNCFVCWENYERVKKIVGYQESNGCLAGQIYVVDYFWGKMYRKFFGLKKKKNTQQFFFSLIWGKIFQGFSVFFLFLVDFNCLVGEKV